MTEIKTLDNHWIEIVTNNSKYFDGWLNTHPIYYSNALAGEIGELCNMIKHNVGGGSNKKTHSNQELAYELADIFSYIILLSEVLGIDLYNFSEIMTEKRKIVIERLEKNNNLNP